MEPSTPSSEFPYNESLINSFRCGFFLKTDSKPENKALRFLEPAKDPKWAISNLWAVLVLGCCGFFVGIVAPEYIE